MLAANVKFPVFGTAVALVLTLPGVGGCGGEPADAPATRASDHVATTGTEAPAGVIAYQTSEGTLRLLRSDGSDDRDIADDVPGEHLQPDWSPDEKRLVFTSRTGIDTLFEADADGRNAHRLIECIYPCIGDESAAYSPDGRRLVFVRLLGPVRGGRPADCGLWILELRTKKVRQLTSHPKCQDREAYPRWSPDGSTLVFLRDSYAESYAGIRANAIFTMSADGGEQRQLTAWKVTAGSPDWSPDGRLIVFSTYPLGFHPDAKVSNIYTMRPDGTDVRQLTGYREAEGRASHPHWLPDGSGIVYVLGRPGQRAIWFMSPDGKERLRIKAGGDSWHPTRQPDP